MSAEELDRKVDEILSRAETERENIIRAARQRAVEILNKPVPTEEYQEEASKIIEEARKEASRIIEEAEELAKKLKASARRNMDEAVRFILEYVTGMKTG
ncbi:MAG: hypothetical protein QXK88_02665 [Desulfurococcaceae archaeon]